MFVFDANKLNPRDFWLLLLFLSSISLYSCQMKRNWWKHQNPFFFLFSTHPPSYQLEWFAHFVDTLFELTKCFLNVYSLFSFGKLFFEWQNRWGKFVFFLSIEHFMMRSFWVYVWTGKLRALTDLMYRHVWRQESFSEQGRIKKLITRYKMR